jgi:hypothetical protein
MPIRIANEAADRGSISAHVFENISMGVQRSLFWSVTLPCSAVEWEGDECATSLTCEWLRWPIRNWICLDGAALESVVAPREAECSFYFSEHHPVAVSSLKLTRIQGTTRFHVAIAGVLDLEGYGDLDTKGYEIAVQGEATLENLIVVPGNLFPKPGDPVAARTVLGEFIDVSNLSAPEWDRFRYVFAPAGDDTQQIAGAHA